MTLIVKCSSCRLLPSPRIPSLSWCSRGRRREASGQILGVNIFFIMLLTDCKRQFKWCFDLLQASRITSRTWFPGRRTMSLNQGFSSFPGVTELKNCADTWTPIYQILLNKEILITTNFIFTKFNCTTQCDWQHHSGGGGRLQPGGSHRYRLHHLKENT